MTRRRSAYARAKARRLREARARRKRLNRIATITVLTLAAIGIFLAIVLYQPSDAAGNAVLPRDVSVSEAYQLYNEGYLLLDVRTPEEWAAGHAPLAVLIPLDELPARLNELPPDEPVLVICRSGNRSVVGRDILLQNGFNAASVTGGMNAWHASGYPVVTP